MIGYFFEQGPRRGVPEIHISSLHESVGKATGISDKSVINAWLQKSFGIAAEGHFAIGGKDAAKVLAASATLGGPTHSEEAIHSGGFSLLLERENLEKVKDCESKDYT